MMEQRIREILFDVTRRKCTQILVVWTPGKAIVSSRYRSRCYPIVSSVDGRNGILRWLTRMRWKWTDKRSVFDDTLHPTQDVLDAMQKTSSRFLSNFRVIGLYHMYVYLLLCVGYKFFVRTTSSSHGFASSASSKHIPCGAAARHMASLLSLPVYYQCQRR